MLSAEVQKKISLLQLHVKKLLKSLLAGDYRSNQKGYGLEFDQLRDYQLGDDIRFIDWKSTARSNKMIVKEYFHEQTKTIMIAVDISASGLFSSHKNLKRDIIAQVATVLALAADYSKAHVGVILFSDTVELYIPPKKNSAHSSMIIKKIWEHVPQGKKTNIKSVLEFLAKISKKDTLLFFVSDLLDSDFQKELGVVAQRYDMVVLRCLDRYERKLPAVGFLHLEDSETGQPLLINLKRSHKELHHFFEQRIEQQNKYLRRYDIDFLDILINQPFIDNLTYFFARRLLR